jgi:hypothetical protein
MPNVHVTLTNLATHVGSSTTSSAEGFYRFSSLAPGEYSINSEVAGFQNAVVQVTLETAQTADVPITMGVAGRVENVAVTAKAPALDTADTRISATLGTAELADLPLPARSFLGLAALAPGVTGLGGTFRGLGGEAPDNFAPERSVDASASGRTFESNMYLVDGMDVTSNVHNGILNVSPNPDSIAEVAIQTNTFNVEQGRTSSIQTVITTKSGTNAFHGTLSWFYFDQHLWARSVFTSKYDPFHKNDFSGTIGGPIIKNRTFFFFSIEPMRSSASSSLSTHTFESPEFVDWAGQNFPSTLGTKLLSQYSITNVVTTGVAATASDIFGSQCGTAATFDLPCNMPMLDSGVSKLSPYRNGLQFNIRMDQYFNQNRDRIYGNFTKTTLTQEEPSLRAGLSTSAPYFVTAFQANETHSFSPSFMNEASFSAYRVEGNVSQGKLPYHIPTVNVVGQDVGISAGGPFTYIQHNYGWRDTLTLLRGRHTLKFGYQGWNGDDDCDLCKPSYTRPTFEFQNLLNLVQDIPYNETGVRFNPITGQPTGGYFFYSTTGGIFAQDEWKAKPNLTLTMGLRWDDFGNTYASHGTILQNMLLGNGTTIDEKIADASVEQFPATYPHSLYKNFSPRVGVAWDPTRQGKWTIRGGFGVFRDWPSLSRTEGPITTNPLGFFSPTLLQGSANPPLFSEGTSDSFPFGFQYPVVGPVTFDSHGGNATLRPQAAGEDRSTKFGPNYNYVVGVERQLPRDTVVSATYSGSYTPAGFDNGTEWPGPDFNRIAGDLLDGRLDRLNPSFGYMAWNTNFNKIQYNSMILAVRRRAGTKGTFQASYTFSHATDYGYDWPDQHLLTQYNAPTDNDAPQRLSFSGVYMLPSLSHQNRLVKGILGTWEGAGTLVLQSGRPFTVYTTAAFNPLLDANGAVIGLQPGSGDYNADGYNFDFPNAPTKSSGGWSRQDYLKGLFTASDFPIPTPGTNGNEKRNGFRGPGFADVDFGLIKNVSISERVRLQVRLESFNLFNRVNLSATGGLPFDEYGGVVSDLSSASFGKSNATYNPRNFQLGLRLTF